MSGLVDAAQQEGSLNVIALPPDWASYGEIIKGFEATYGVTVVSTQPEASSPDEITTARSLQGQCTAPDVFDLSGAVATASTSMFAAYKVETFDDVPHALKEASGLWVGDFGGYMSIGYDAGKVPAPTTVKDLLKPGYRGKVALRGDPTHAGAGLSAVLMAAIDHGGTADDISRGVAFFASLKAAGNRSPITPTTATIESGETPVVLDWDYLNVSQGKKLRGTVDWRTVIPTGSVVGEFFVQAISKDAPHPAAARLWQEYLYSDEAQNLWLKGGPRPAREAAMVRAGTIDAAAHGALPPVSGTPVFPTAAQEDRARAYLADSWLKAIG